MFFCHELDWVELDLSKIVKATDIWQLSEIYQIYEGLFLKDLILLKKRPNEPKYRQTL